MTEPLVLSDACFGEYLKTVHAMTGIQIDQSRKTMLVGRLRRRVTELSLTYEGYLEKVRTDKAEGRQFIDLTTTNETYFYRTPRVWEFFNEEFLPKWDTQKTLRIWSAAASTGEEAHTLGILCQAHKERNPGFQYKIFGTDISTEVVDIARKGTYNGRSIRRFRGSHPELFEKYMQGDDANGYQAIPAIKANLDFVNHNLFSILAGRGPFDFIFLRNVLIYFSKEDQERVLFNATRVAAPEAFLVIGESESISRLDTEFEPYAHFVYRLGGAESDVA